MENIQQPLLAAALTDALGAAGRIHPGMLIGSNFGLVLCQLDFEGVVGVVPLCLPPRFGATTGDCPYELFHQINLDRPLVATAKKKIVVKAEQAEQERQRAEALAAKLRELGVDPDQLT